MSANIICRKCQQPICKDDGNTKHFNPMHSECWIDVLRGWYRSGTKETRQCILGVIEKIKVAENGLNGEGIK